MLAPRPPFVNIKNLEVHIDENINHDSSRAEVRAGVSQPSLRGRPSDGPDKAISEIASATLGTLPRNDKTPLGNGLHLDEGFKDQFEAQFHRNFGSFLKVTVEIAEGVIDLAVLATPLGVVVLGRMNKKAEASETELPSIVFGPKWATAFETFQRALFASGTSELNQPLGVVLSADNPIARFFLEPAIVRAVLGMKEPVHIKIAAPDEEFKRQVEARVVRQLSAIEKAEFSKVIRIHREKFSTFAATEGLRGAGILIESKDQLSALDPPLAVTIANLAQENREEAAELILPILLIAARLGALANGHRIAPSELTAIEATLMEAWSRLGISISIEDGRVVGTILLDVLRQWLETQEARAAIEEAA